MKGYLFKATLVGLSFWTFPAWANVWGKHSVLSTKPLPRPSRTLLKVRGGADNHDDNNDDDERYSRQVYTLGARAHGLIRSATIYVDGPVTSGLVLESVKNLALSGVGKIVLITSHEPLDDSYFFSNLDDLGRTYIRGARAELGIDEDDENISTTDIMVGFLRKLNPSLSVETMTREDLHNNHHYQDSNGILLCVDRPYDTQVLLNNWSRKHGVSFVAVETAGIFGRIFSDFGDTFDVHDTDGETPLVVSLDRIDIEDRDTRTLLVRAVSGERHDVSRGDEIKFQRANGEFMDITCTVTQIKTSELIAVQFPSTETMSLEDFVEEVNTKVASYSRIKQLQTVLFVPLEEATKQAEEDSSIFTPCDLDKSFDDVRRGAVFACFQALNKFVMDHKRQPKKNDYSEFLASTKKFCSETTNNDDVRWAKHCETFVSKCAAKFAPLQAVFGAIAAQECLKAASGIYFPIRQFLLYDCDEVLVPSLDSNDHETEESETTGLAYILGDKVKELLCNKKLFVVGSGAIGCEILKNLAAMNAGTGKKGRIVVTDMDTIERSNLSRQLLFRDGDISKFKSKAAEEAVARLNPAVKMECHTSKVGDDEAGPFNRAFWSKKVDIVLNALDNVEARLFIDKQCVSNQKALIDAGTLGSKGNVQIVVPHQSESYASSADPPEPAIPVCTLKNFPYAISHTIQWGRDVFDGLFTRRPKQANQYKEVLESSNIENLAATIDQDFGETADETARELVEDIAVMADDVSVANVKTDAIAWALSLTKMFFYDSIVKLLLEHPVDSVDEDGEPFWSGSRKPPEPLKFSKDAEQNSLNERVNENLINFVCNAARLRIECILGEGSDAFVSREDAKVALESVNYEEKSSPDDESTVEGLLRPLTSFSPTKLKLNIAEFEKDDDSNGHVAFITAASNLRAICYGIPPVDALETRRVAGRIVPAMITTTAFVSALSCIELIKVIQAVPLNSHRNAFINLALPFFAFTSPLPAEQIPGLHGKTFTLWDRIEIKESKKQVLRGGLTLREFLTGLKRKSTDDPDNIEIASITYGHYMIYASFLNGDDDEILDRNLWTVVQEAVSSGDDFEHEFSRASLETGSSDLKTIDNAILDFTVTVEDLETGEELELPPVRVVRKSSKININ